MRARISNLSSLVDFECAARWQSIKLAAKELNKSPSAVSQQIKLLEQQLGFELFERKTRQINLTEKGVQFSATAHHLLKELDHAILALQAEQSTSVLRISCIHSFAMKWLVARVPSFAQNNPEVDVHIESSHKKAELENDEIDIAIRYAKIGTYPETKLIRRERLIAVYSPKLTAEQLTPEDLTRFPLLVENSRALWVKWMQINACLEGRHKFTQNFGHSGLLVQAAVSGYGIALAPETIALDDLKAGNLVRLLSEPLLSDYGYFFLTNPRVDQLPKTISFRKWIEAELSLI